MGEEKPTADPRFHGRRHGRRLRPHRRELLDTLLPQLRVDIPPEAAAFDPAALFGDPVRAVWLEIGFGNGEHLVWQAERNSDIGMIGAEPYINGVARMLSHIQDTGVDNIRVLPDDVRPLLQQLPAKCLERVFILFPDPWPKARHHGRRIVSTETLDQLAHAMPAGAELRLASDDADYIAWMLRVVLDHADFEWLATGPADWRTRPDDWPPTRYEEKNRSGGPGPVFLRFRRC